MGKWLGENDDLHSQDILVYQHGGYNRDLLLSEVGRPFCEITDPDRDYYPVEAYRPSKGEHIETTNNY
jgi:hypothetical protein